MTAPSTNLARRVGLVGVLLSGAIFGFFYAWVCSTMWGLDAADPRVAIEAMQEMNDSVQNAVFFPAFFLTPFVLAGTAALAYRSGARGAAKWFGAAAIAYFLGGLLVTMAINVPMNEDLAALAVPDSLEAAERVWDDYSSRWQIWNQTRTVFSGLSLALAAIGLNRLGHHRTDMTPAG